MMHGQQNIDNGFYFIPVFSVSIFYNYLIAHRPVLILRGLAYNQFILYSFIPDYVKHTNRNTEFHLGK
jgi:hypothetical protein